MNKNYIETQDKYNQLAEHQRILLNLLALIDQPQTKTKILQVLAKAKVKDKENRNYTTITLGKDLDKLKSLWLVKKNYEQKYQIYPDAFDFVMRQTVADKRLKTWHKGVVDIFPGISSSSFYNRTTDRLLRDACFAVYTNNFEVFAQIMDALFDYHNIHEEEVFKHIFVDRYGVDNIKDLSPLFQFHFYHSQMDVMINNLEDISQPLKTISELTDQLDPDSKTFANKYLCLNAILQGDWNTVDKICTRTKSIDTWKFMGWMHFAQGNNKKALTYYETALKALRKEERSKKAYFYDYHGIIYILVLLKDSNNHHLPAIKKFIKEVFSYNVSNSYLIIATIIEALQNNKTRAEELFSQEFIYYNIDGLFYLYAQYWTQIYAPNWENYAYTLHHKANKNGYYWVAYNIAVLMQELSKSKADYYAKSVQELAKKVNHVPPLIDIIAIREDWEIALQALEAINGSSNALQVDQQNRLIWLVDFERLQVQPKVQKMNKNGKWSKGRNVSLSKLAHGQVEEASLQDTRVSNTLSQDFSWYGSGSYDFFDMEKTFKALVGHPLLFLLKSPDVACELQLGSPELIVKEVAKGYEIKPNINISEVGCIIKKETPTRYILIEITPQHVQLAHALGGKKLVIPKKGKEKLEKTLANLTTVIPLQSDLDYQDDSIPSVEADGRIYVHLLPVGDGFHVELFVKPFKICPPYFKPGEGSTRSIAVLEGIRSQTQRDLTQEQKASKELIQACPTLSSIKPQKGLWQLDTPLSCLELLRELEPLKLANEIVIEWPKGEKIKIKRHVDFDNLQLSIKKENDWFGISGKVHINENLVIDMRQLLAMMQQQKSEFIELDDGQFLALSKQLKKQLNNIHKFSDDQGKIHPLAGFALEGLTEQIENLEIDQAWDNHIKNLKASEKKKFKEPKTLKATLRDYQKEGFQWLSKLADWGVGACLADDMGLGKTVQALAVMLQRSKKGPSLVVAPASVCRNWVKEIEKFAPSLQAILFSETDRKQTIEQAKAEQVLITTYGLLQSESELFASKKFVTIVLDEAQAIKNSAAKRSKAAMKLQGDFKIITTGTPIENHLGELWNLFRFINPGLLGSLKGFRERFAIPIEKDKDEETQEQLQLLIRPFILRRHKTEVLKELPAKTEIVLSVDLSEEEQAFYEAMRRMAIESLESNDEEQAGAKHLKVLAQLMRLRRACCNPKTKLKSSKLKLFGSIIEELLANGHKALVFSQFVGHLKLIEDYVKSKGITYQYLDGATPTKKRQQRIDAFQNGEGELFLISLKAGGTGLNLTAADYVIHMDPWWNPAVEDQASDRAHRIGQVRPVTVYRLITQNTIEEKIIKLHESKRDLADSLLEGTDASSKLSASDLLDLIKGQ